MKKILFVCHGNICRSPMAQSICQHLVNKQGLGNQYIIDSAATSQEEIGNSIYPLAKKKLLEKGIEPVPHYARQITKQDLIDFDEIYVMDQNNLRNCQRMFGNVSKIKKLSDYDISDPWYSGNFEQAYQDCLKGVEKILQKNENNC